MHSPVHKLDVKLCSGGDGHFWVSIRFKSQSEIVSLAASLLSLADKGEFDHLHLQDTGLYSDNPSPASLEVNFERAYGGVRYSTASERRKFIRLANKDVLTLRG